MTRPLPKKFRLQLALRGRDGLQQTPLRAGGFAGPSAGTTEPRTNGQVRIEAAGQANPTATEPAVSPVVEANPDPMRRRIRSRRRPPWWLRWARWLWARRPWRPLTEEEKRERTERKRRAALEKLLKSEAKQAIRLIQNALDRRGLSYRHRKSDGVLRRIDYVQFDVVALQPDALYLRVDTRRLPYGVGILDLVREEILTDLSLSIGRRVMAEYSERKGLWYIIERASGVRGIPKHVKFAEMLDHMPKTADPLTVPLGMTVNARRVYRSLADMPHLLIAGATDTGKSNMVNVILGTLIMRNGPDHLKMLLVDLKGGMEFSFYEGLPHLLAIDGVTDTGIVYDRDQVPEALAWLIAEGERRMALLKARGHKNIASYNRRRRPSDRLPRILLVVDEWADIKLARGVGHVAEDRLANIASRMRAVGIHVIIATQVPKREVISTIIKTNLPARMAFSVPTYTASQLIIDTGDARGLTPRGRFVYAKGASHLTIQAPYISDRLIREIVRGAIEGGGVPIQAVDVTPEEIMEWAIDNLDGRLPVRTLFDAFRGRISQHMLRDWLAEWEGQEFTIRGRVYRVEPGEGSRPRRLVLVEG